jgi:hypothetical protein
MNQRIKQRSEIMRKTMDYATKIKRLKWEIDEIKEFLKKQDKKGIIQIMLNSIKRREDAIKWLRENGNLTWDEVQIKFGFNYYSHYYRVRK